MKELFKLKVDLLIKGVRGDLKLLREGGGGPVGGVSIKIDDCVVNAPHSQEFVKNSPYEIKIEGNKYKLLKNGKTVTNVLMPKEPEYYKHHIDGIEMRKIVALDGFDTLVTSVLRYCYHKRKCLFCSLEHGSNFVREKKPKQIVEVVKKAIEEDRNRHMVITTGTPPTPDKGALIVSKVVKAVKSEIEIPIQVQIEPPKMLKFIDELYNAGADSVSFNIETFDVKIRDKVVPEKPPIEEYLRCLSYSLNLFGDSNVSSWLLVGLGESFNSLIDGCSALCEIGTIPFVVPFRPLNSKQSTCSFKRLIDVYIKAAEIMRSYGVRLKGKAGCLRCQACSAISEAIKIDNFQTENL